MAKKLNEITYPEPGEKVTEYQDARGRTRLKVTLDCGEGLTEQSQAKATCFLPLLLCTSFLGSLLLSYRHIFPGALLRDE